MSKEHFQQGWITKKCGSWYGHFHAYFVDPVSNEEKRSHRVVVLGKTAHMGKREASIRLTEVISEQLGKCQSGGRDPAITVEQFFEQEYIPWYRPNWAPHVRQRTEYHIRRYVTRSIANRRMRDITLRDLQIIILDLQEREFSEATVRQCAIRLQSIFKLAAHLHYIESDVSEELPIPLGDSPRPVLQPEQLRALIASVTNLRDVCVLLVAVCCLLRSGEVLGLRWGSYRKTHFHIGTTSCAGQLIFGTKTQSSKADVHIPQLLREVIEAWFRVCSDVHPDALMFPARTGNPMRPEDFLRRLKPIARALEIPPELVTFRVFRRSGATDLQHFGNLKVVQTILRHDWGSDTAMKHYIQPVEPAVAKAADLTAQAVVGDSVNLAQVTAPRKKRKHTRRRKSGKTSGTSQAA